MTAVEADEEIGNLNEKEVVMVEEITEVLERRQKDKLPAIRDIPKKLLEETAKADKFCVNLEHTTLQRPMNFYAGAVVVTNRLGVKINKEAERKEPMRRRRL